MSAPLKVFKRGKNLATCQPAGDAESLAVPPFVLTVFYSLPALCQIQAHSHSLSYWELNLDVYYKLIDIEDISSRGLAAARPSHLNFKGTTYIHVVILYERRTKWNVRLKL